MAALAAINAALLIAPIDYAALGRFVYAGAFLITLIANAALVLPVPYLPVIAHMAAHADSAEIVVLAAALGSVLGESVTFFVGRTQVDALRGRRWFERARGLATSEWRAAIALTIFAIPPNPVFDLGGLAAGALGMRWRTFFVAVLVARTVRFAALASLAGGLGGVTGSG